MKHLFISSERVLVQEYRTGLPFRLAAAAIFAGALLQIPVMVNAVTSWRQYQGALARQETLRAETQGLQAQLVPLQDLQRKLQQIHAWEPVFKNRLPVSALLGAVERSIPDEAVLAVLSIEADQFERVPVNGGVYRIPTNFRLVVQGETYLDRGAAVQSFSENLLRCLPPGTEEIRNERQPRTATGFSPFTLQYSVKPNGNYFGLSVRRVADPDPL